ncbi:uncharacterized protein LOC116618428 [Nematostella vectensis]|uniref:uncharacterized protein LOC116618428 n=1 Tax=Nematostella vectensis TaxID=45351 RepID=UPI002076F152|nr:uncharacterized protein LOC116618428 [Nematostella vectensis]
MMLPKFVFLMLAMVVVTCPASLIDRPGEYGTLKQDFPQVHDKVQYDDTWYDCYELTHNLPPGPHCSCAFLACTGIANCWGLQSAHCFVFNPFYDYKSMSEEDCICHYH